MAFRIDYKKNRLLFHILFWVGYFLVSIAVLWGTYDLVGTLYRVFAGMLVNSFLIYINLYWVFPNFFIKGKYILHYLIMGFLVFATASLRVWFDINYMPRSPLLAIEFGTVSHFASRVIVSIMVISFSSSFKYMEDYLEAKQTEQELKTQRLEAELKLLKTQVNPHFLFNSLNNLYSLTRIHGKAAAPLLLKLSSMMRYMIYESNEDKVPLRKEIEYLHNYIDLQQIKTEEPQNIHLEVKGDIEGVEVAPMLFIPFLENSIKHGNLHEAGPGFVKATIEVTNKQLLFEVSNTINQGGQRDEVGGIGLENVQKRLALIYPQKHQLDTFEKDGIYYVSLKLDRK